MANQDCQTPVLFTGPPDPGPMPACKSTPPSLWKCAGPLPSQITVSWFRADSTKRSAEALPRFLYPVSTPSGPQFNPNYFIDTSLTETGPDANFSLTFNLNPEIAAFYYDTIPQSYGYYSPPGFPQPPPFGPGSYSPISPLLGVSTPLSGPQPDVTQYWYNPAYDADFGWHSVHAELYSLAEVRWGQDIILETDYGVVDGFGQLAVPTQVFHYVSQMKNLISGNIFVACFPHSDNFPNVKLFKLISDLGTHMVEITNIKYADMLCFFQINIGAGAATISQTNSIVQPSPSHNVLVGQIPNKPIPKTNTGDVAYSYGSLVNTDFYNGFIGWPEFGTGVVTGWILKDGTVVAPPDQVTSTLIGTVTGATLFGSPDQSWFFEISVIP